MKSPACHASRDEILAAGRSNHDSPKYYIWVWDSEDGCLLLVINEGVTLLFNTGLLWSNNHLFIIFSSFIQQIDRSTVLKSNVCSCIALLKHRTLQNVPSHFGTRPIPSSVISNTLRTYVALHSLWMTTLSQLVGSEGKSLSTVCLALLLVSCFIQLWSIQATLIYLHIELDPFVSSTPNIWGASHWDDTMLNSCKFNRFVDTEASLTKAIHNSQSQTHHALASWALVWACLLQWDQAITNATEVFLHLLSHALILIQIKSIKIEPSVIGYIAKSVALAGKREKHKVLHKHHRRSRKESKESFQVGRRLIEASRSNWAKSPSK